MGNHSFAQQLFSKASSQILLFFLSASFRCSTASASWYKSLVDMLCDLMIVSTGSIVLRMLEMKSFSIIFSISALFSIASRILLHFSVVHAHITSTFTWITLFSTVSSCTKVQQSLREFSCRSAYFISRHRDSSSSTILSLSFSLLTSSLRLGQSPFIYTCCSSHSPLHSQQNSHEQMHFMCEQPTFFSMGWWHFGHSLVLFLIQFILVSSELMISLHFCTCRQLAGAWGYCSQRKQYISPQGQFTMPISMRLGLEQKFGHFSLGQQQTSLFWIAQLMHIFLRQSSFSSGATVCTKLRRTGAWGQGSSFMQPKKICPACSSALIQPLQQFQQYLCPQVPEEYSLVSSKQTGHTPFFVPSFSYFCCCTWQLWALVLSRSQFSLKKQLVSFQMLQPQCWQRQTHISSSSMKMMLLTSGTLARMSLQSSSSRMNLDSNCSVEAFCSYCPNQLELLVLEQVQRRCRSESSLIFRPSTPSSPYSSSNYSSYFGEVYFYIGFAFNCLQLCKTGISSSLHLTNSDALESNGFCC